MLLHVAFDGRYPFSVNTDDPGVFDTDLPTEFAHLATSHKIDRDGMARLACRAVQVSRDVAFGGEYEGTKHALLAPVINRCSDVRSACRFILVLVSVGAIACY